MLNLSVVFDQCDGEYLKFTNIVSPLHHRPDMCAFILLDKLVPSSENIISCAEHDEIYLSIDCDKLAEVATEDDIIMLRRCGIRYKKSENALAMFV